MHLVVAVAAVIAFVIAVRVRPGSEQEAVRTAIRTGAAPTRIDGTRVAIVEAEHALACAVPGRAGGVLLSTGLAARLTEDELQAVVAHEAAHLRERHDLLVGVAESIERAVPWVPGARAMARSTRVLVELAADDAAARRVGRDAVRRAVLAADDTSALARVRASRLA
jgi:Zn-dependent protease with chaperone function